MVKPLAARDEVDERFTWNRQSVFGDEAGWEQAVQEILSRWYGEDYIYVKVRTEDDRLCVLRYDAPSDRWTVALAPVREGVPIAETRSVAATG